MGAPVHTRVPEDIYIQYLALDAKRLPWERTTPSVVVSHESAGYLLGIGTFPADVPVFHEQPVSVLLGGRRFERLTIDSAPPRETVQSDEIPEVEPPLGIEQMGTISVQVLAMEVQRGPPEFALEPLAGPRGHRDVRATSRWHRC